MPFPEQCRKVLAFTLLELLITFAIIGLLAMLLFPAVTNLIGGSHQAKALSNMRQIHTGLIGYHGDNGRFPNLVTLNEGGGWGNPAWHHHAAEYLGYAPEDMAAGREPPAVFLDPAAKTHSWRGDYGVVYHSVHGPIRLENSESLHSLRRPSRTPLLITAQQVVNGEPAGTWFVPNHDAPNPGGTEISDRHQDGAVVVFADGHGHWMRRDELFEQYFPWRNE